MTSLCVKPLIDPHMNRKNPCALRRFSLGCAACALCLFLCFVSSDVRAQRLRPQSGRGVVVSAGDQGTLVSWRRTAGEREDDKYNVYVRTSGGEYTLLNDVPVEKTNLQVSSSAVPKGAQVAVSAVAADGGESDLSEPWTVGSYSWNNVVLNIDFETDVLDPDDYRVKYIWPADLDGDGEMEFVVDRLSTTDISERSHKLQAYDRNGNCLWTVDMGPNVNIDSGQNDMVTAADVDCDGRAEVIIRSSDGTRFWDQSAGTWGTYVFGGDDPDVDADGIVDYFAQSVRTPPFYASVIDGQTGAEKASAWLDYAEVTDGVDTWTRTNLGDYYDASYGFMEGHFCVAYLDGVHPSVVMECQTRTTDGNHHTYVFVFAYDFASAQSVGTDWHHCATWALGLQNPAGATFHQLRVADVDGDGLDEMVQGGYSVNPLSGTYVYPGVGHGDRFRLSDINPSRPGLEMYVIQQSALLGQALYDAATGEHLKEWYLSAVGDVGRGECMDVDPDHFGYEIYSTMNGLYDCAGDIIAEGETSYPYEGIWWDGDLGREVLGSHGGSGWATNVMINEYDGTRLIQMSKESSYEVHSCTANRPLFFGDILGDWREEVILARQGDESSSGFVVYATDYPSDYSFYYLQDDPHYTGDCSARGYYQSPNTGFYLGYDMPLPPLPPTMRADVRYVSGGWDGDLADGKSILFDLTGENSDVVDISGAVKPDSTLFITPKGHDYSFGGSGSIDGMGDIWKSGQGRVALSVDLTTTGTTYISEGILAVDGRIEGPVDLRARGTLEGNVTLADTVVFEGALNYEGCRLRPGTCEDSLGVITFEKGLNIASPVYFEMDIRAGQTCEADLIEVAGDLTVGAEAVFTIVADQSGAQPGLYRLLKYSGSFAGSLDLFAVRGLTGLSYDIVDNEGAIWLQINEQREASDDVVWTGDESGVWDYKALNFVSDGAATEFVAGDEVLFNDEASEGTVSVDELMPVSGLTVDNSVLSYTFSGDGGISGEGGLTKNGDGALVMELTKSDYTGATVINGGTVTVKELADGGTVSSFGAATADVGNWKISGATLVVNSSSASTNRALSISDTVTLQNASGTLTLGGQVSGSGTLLKAGSGQLSLSYGDANTWTGGTVLKGGTLAMGAWNTSFGATTSAITAYGGTIVVFDNNSTSAVPVFANALHVADGRTVTLQGGSRCKVQGSLTGSGTLKVTFPYVRGDFSTNTSAFEGLLWVTSGQFRLTSALDLAKGRLQVDDGVYVCGVKSQSSTETSFTHSIGALESEASDATFGTGVWNVGYLGTDTEFAGVFNSSATFNKYGSGLLTLSGESAAPIAVHEGAVALMNDEGTTSAVVTVYDGATVCGTGATKSVVVRSGGMVGAGKLSSSVIGTLSLTGGLTVKSGGMVRFRARSTRIDKIVAAGSVSLSDPIFVMERINGEWQADTDYQIFDVEGDFTVDGDITFSPEVPMEGYLWDTSSLVSDGILRITADPTAVSSVRADGGSAVVYDIAGRCITDVKQSGIYVVDGKKRVLK